MSLKFDFSGLFHPNLEGGLREEEIEDFEEKVREIISHIKENPPGFMRLDLEWTESVKELKEWIMNFDSLVVLGIGGSALGNIALHTSLKPLNWNYLSKEERKGFLRVFIVDNVDPDLLSFVLDLVDIGKTVFNVISKSGSTAEAMANYMIARGLLESSGLNPKDHLVFTTDPEKGALRRIAKEEGIRVLNIPPDVGGRFSVLTPVGMLSAFAEGIDIDEIHEGARDAFERSLKTNVFENPSAMIAITHYLYLKKGKNISVMMAYSNRLYAWADWYRQLWAESLGKKYDLEGKVVNTGQTPIKALGTTDQHSQIQLYNEGPNDKVITFLVTNRFEREIRIPKVHENVEELGYMAGKYLSELLLAEQRGTEISFLANGRPSMKVMFDEINEYNVGQFVAYYEVATVIMGALLNINPFDQPGVELGKKITYHLMGRKGYEKMDMKEFKKRVVM